MAYLLMIRSVAAPCNILTQGAFGGIEYFLKTVPAQFGMDALLRLQTTVTSLLLVYLCVCLGMVVRIKNTEC